MRCGGQSRLPCPYALRLGLSLVAGGLRVWRFFVGLWWAVHKLVSSKRPALLVFASMLLRTGLTLAGFYFVARGHWERLVACLIGFVVARLIVTWLTRLKDKPSWMAEAASHASLPRYDNVLETRVAQV